MKPSITPPLALLASLLLFAAPSLATDDAVRACVADAKEQKNLCKTVCKEEYRADKDTCFARDHECAEACRDDRNACVAAIFDELEACILPCQNVKALAIAECKDLYQKDSVDRDQCIDEVQLVAFQCRDDCREKVGVRERAKECRRANRRCIRACDAPPESSGKGGVGASTLTLQFVGSE